MTQNVKYFNERVRSAARNLPTYAIDIAINHHASIGKTEIRHVGDCVQLAGVWAAMSPENRIDEETQSVDSPAPGLETE